MDQWLMRAHFPRPETVSLSAWRTQSRHGRASRRPRQGLIPGTSKVVCSGQSKEATGQGVCAEKGTTTEGHRWDAGPICKQTEEEAEFRADTAHLRGATEADSTAWHLARHADYRHPRLRLEEQAQDKA